MSCEDPSGQHQAHPSVDAARGIGHEALRTAFGGFATGVTIVTCVDAGGRRVGLTVNSFSSLSLTPPLALWSLRRTSPNRRAFAAASHFAVNVLALDQVELAQRFATAGENRFAEGIWSEGLGDAPVLAGSVAVLECALESIQEAGDHILFIGRVDRCHHYGTAPLIYHAGHYRSLTEPFAPPAHLPG